MKNSKEKVKSIKGITLVALVITIIVLLILAGIVIVQLQDNGLFEKSKLAKEKAQNSQELENSILGSYENNIDIFTRSSVPMVYNTINIIDGPAIKNNTTYQLDKSITDYKYLIIVGHSKNRNYSC